MVDVNLKITETLYKLYPKAPRTLNLIIGEDKKDMYSRSMIELVKADFVGYKVIDKFILIKNSFGASLLVIDYINGTANSVQDLGG